MINLIWFAMFALAFLAAGFNGTLDATTQALFAATEQTVTFCLGLVGILAFWSGIMRIAEVSGLTGIIARAFHPLLKRLFPQIKNQATLGAVALSLAANLLGLSNAATPLGLKAIRDLARENPQPGRLSPAICTFVTLILGGVTLFPTTVIAFRAKTGSQSPAAILWPILGATLFGTAVALILNRLFSGTRRP
ncbi:MAG TPA: spore maturation protein [Firmicutes bacterium]|jgi:spore maturation protein A|nr:spore maturation protein [Bacillota bacterium]HOQ23375.1 nucleoside recognition domain-containing protein [Bacillota bacterium]HPT66793.1 nucleoside recognition domain-containing protein [Bacillota bacterium]